MTSKLTWLTTILQLLARSRNVSSDCLSHDARSVIILRALWAEGCEHCTYSVSEASNSRLDALGSDSTVNSSTRNVPETFFFFSGSFASMDCIVYMYMWIYNSSIPRSICTILLLVQPAGQPRPRFMLINLWSWDTGKLQVQQKSQTRKSLVPGI